MKKLMFALVLATAVSTVNAQTMNEKTTENDYNKWSIELAGGVNKTQRPMSANYFTSTPSPYTVDLGARYMFNNKFGLKADFGYNSFEGKNNSLSFDTKYYRANLQAVANLEEL